MDEMTEEFEDTSEVGQLLEQLTEKQFRFWELMNEGRHNQREAYRAAYGCEVWSDNAISVQACKLWSNPKFVLIRTALKNVVVEQVARSLEERIAEMEAFADRCENAGQYGASGKARENVAKLEGHYVIKTQSVANRSDELGILKDIAKDGSKESIAYALKEAKSLGLDKELKAALGTLH